MSSQCDEGWILKRSTDDDLDALMQWFPEKHDVEIWGGPDFRFPFTRESFLEDCHWGEMASFSLYDPSENIAAFGQLYERTNRINLARLVAHPARRGEGIGKRLVEMLMAVGRPMFPCDEYSLFVFRDNTPAYECYRSMGFVVTDYSEDVPLADECYYLTRPVED